MFNPKFQITSRMLNDLSKIEVIKAKISTCKIHPKEEFILKRDAIISMVHNSTAIEGNVLNEFEVKKVLEGKNVNANIRQIYEVKNYKKALDFISKRHKNNINSKDILKIHKLTTKNILSEERNGQYRKEMVYVVKRSLGYQSIIYTAPNHKIVRKLISELCNWINKAKKEKLSPIIIAGIAHAQIAAIHPFTDGNGRTARLLATLILYNYQYDFRKLFALENFYNKDRQGYYDAIHLGGNYEERVNNSLTGWLEYFSSGFLFELESVFEKIKPFTYLKSNTEKRIILNKEEIKIMDFISEMQSINSKDVLDILEVNIRTAQRILAKLIKKELIKKHGSRKNTKYLMP